MATRRDGASRRLVWTVCLLHLLPSVHGQCARFEFPGATTPSSGNCTVEVPLSNPLPFSLNSHNCSRGQQSFTITVSLFSNDSNHHLQVCKLRIIEGKCRNLGGVCLCGQSKGSYFLNKKLSNGTLLIWHTSASFVKEARVCIREQDTDAGRKEIDEQSSESEKSKEKSDDNSEEKSDEQDDGSHVLTVIIVVNVVMLTVPVIVLVLVVVKRCRVKSRETDGQLRSAGRTCFREVQSSVLRDDMTTPVFGTDHGHGEDKGDSRWPDIADSPPPTVDVDDLPPPWTTAMASSTEDGWGTLPPNQLQPLGGLLHRFDF